MAIYTIKADEAKLHISKGNNKIGKGIWSFSTLPGNASHMIYINGSKDLLTDIPGTCSKYCDGCARDGACYAWRDAKLHHNVTVRAWGENTLLLRSGKVWDLLDEFFAQKNKKAMEILASWNPEHHDDRSWETVLALAIEAAKIRTFRINVSGELESVDDLNHWANIAAKHPETQFGIYTKNYDALLSYFDSRACHPGNLVINVSEWHGVASAAIAKLNEKYKGQFNVFEYDDHNKKDCDLSEAEVARLEAEPHCPAVLRNGHHAKTPDGTPITCDMCRRCYRKTGARTAVWSH